MPRSRTVADVGEKLLIRELIEPICRSNTPFVGVGDDGAVLDFPAGEQLIISTDKIPEDLLALQLGLMDPFHHGRYLATINVSDIAAMGGKPLGLLCTLALPNDFVLEYLRKFMEGFVAGGAEWDVPVVGGDTGWASTVCLSATAFGSIEAGKALLRSNATVGDGIFASGILGGFSTALAYFIVAKPMGLQLSDSDEAWLKNRLILPLARVDVGRVLAQSGICTSCMDITDGVGQSLKELAEASQTHFEIRMKDLPIHPVTVKVAKFLRHSVEHIVFGIGLDLELIGTLHSSDWVSDKIKIFGEVRDGQPGVSLRYDDHVAELPVSGWQHFTGSAMEIARKLYAPITQ